MSYSCSQKVSMNKDRRFSALPPALKGASVVTDAPAPAGVRLLRLPHVEDRTGIKKTAIYGMIKAGAFPAPIKIGNMTLWLESEVEHWILDQVAQHRRQEAC